MNKKHKIRGTFASYKQSEGSPVCDLDEMARYISENVGHIPLHIGDARACEIHLLAKAFLILSKKYKKEEE